MDVSSVVRWEPEGGRVIWVALFVGAIAWPVFTLAGVMAGYGFWRSRLKAAASQLRVGDE